MRFIFRAAVEETSNTDIGCIANDIGMIRAMDRVGDTPEYGRLLSCCGRDKADERHVIVRGTSYPDVKYVVVDCVRLPEDNRKGALGHDEYTPDALRKS